MLTFSLNSGSNGNSIYVEAEGVRLLFDAGISGRQAASRMLQHGRDIRDVDAVIISHDHVDHVSSAGVFQRMFDLPLYMTRRTHMAIRTNLGRLHDVRYFRSGDALQFGSVTVHTIPTPHDAADGVAFVVECAGRRLGILTDLGHAFSGLQDLLSSVDGAYLECNYDPEMLENGPYPWELQERIRGLHGHLSNEDSADLLHACGRKRPAWIAAAHLSAANNTPELALDAPRRAVGHGYPVHLAPRWGCSEMFRIP